MEGCIAPGEILDDNQPSTFGAIAEDIIYADFIRTRSYSPGDIYVDNYNPSGYMYFLKTHNPQLELLQFATVLAVTRVGMKRPDFLIHTRAEKVFYEIKPDSDSGEIDGVDKVVDLMDTYRKFGLPYRPGQSYKGCDVIVASLGDQITVRFKARLVYEGLLLYRLCLKTREVVDVVIISSILRYVIAQMNRQARGRSFTPIDLRPAFAGEGQLANFARKLGLVMAAAAATTVVAAGTAVVVKVGWSFFWKAVAKRFAARGALALFLAGSTGPLPVGELLAAGMTIWMIVDVIRLSSTLWTEAAQIARDGA